MISLSCAAQGKFVLWEQTRKGLYELRFTIKKSRSRIQSGISNTPLYWNQSSIYWYHDFLINRNKTFYWIYLRCYCSNSFGQSMIHIIIFFVDASNCYKSRFQVGRWNDLLETICQKWFSYPRDFYINAVKALFDYLVVSFSSNKYLISSNHSFIPSARVTSCLPNSNFFSKRSESFWNSVPPSSLKLWTSLFYSNHLTDHIFKRATSISRFNY